MASVAWGASMVELTGRSTDCGPAGAVASASLAASAAPAGSLGRGAAFRK